MPKYMSNFCHMFDYKGIIITYLAVKLKYIYIINSILMEILKLWCNIDALVFNKDVVAVAVAAAACCLAWSRARLHEYSKC